jgi:hypothetical protein
MAKLSHRKIAKLLSTARSAGTTHVQGRTYEDLLSYVFETVPGITVTSRDQHNVFHSEEVDIACWNERRFRGLPFLPEILLIECKNWSASVGAAEVNWFASKLRNKGLSHGVLVAANGITGVAAGPTAAHTVLANALRDGQRIIVVTDVDLLGLATTDDLVRLFKQKLCELVVIGTA